VFGGHIACSVRQTGLSAILFGNPEYPTFWEIIKLGSRNSLLWLHAVNRFVAGQQSTDDCATQQTDHRADFGSLGRLNKGAVGVLQRSLMVSHRADPSACSRADRSPDKRVAQTMLVFHEFHAAHVLSLDRQLARFLLQRDRHIRNTQKRPGDFRRVHFNRLNFLPRLKRVQVLPGRWVALGPRSTGYSQDAKHE
jgi:hypothetical protein